MVKDDTRVSDMIDVNGSIMVYKIAFMVSCVAVMPALHCMRIVSSLYSIAGTKTELAWLVHFID